jgi:hypothetical protein
MQFSLCFKHSYYIWTILVDSTIIKKVLFIYKKYYYFLDICATI